MLCASHCFRVCRHICPHLLSINTYLEWDDAGSLDLLGNPAQKEAQRKRAAFPPNDSPGGYRLLETEDHPAKLWFQRIQTTNQRIGRVESLAFHAWFTAVQRITSRPEMFGAMIEVYRAAQAVYREFLVQETDEAGGYLALTALEMGEYFQQAYQQRLQFSPVVTGAPPINGQLPFGINQVVRMMDGLAAVIMQAAFLGDEEDATNPDLPARTNLVVFGHDPAIAIRAMLDFGILKLSLLQAMTPLSLPLLFHELGHLLVRRTFWAKDPNKRNYAQFMEERGKWTRTRQSVVTEILEQLDELPNDNSNVVQFDLQGLKGLKGLKGQLDPFLEDIFAHAVWRRVGCGGDFDLFLI